MGSFANQQVWLVQRCSRNVKKSVWEPTFLDAAIDILRDGLWREYPHEIWDRTCKFDDVKDFLTSEDGLGWPDVKATCAMIRTVAESKAATTIRMDADTTLQDLAKQLLEELEAAGVTELAAQVDEAKEAPLLPHGDTDSKARSDSGQFAKAEGEQRSSGRQGTSKEYLLRRIARDHPEMLDDIGPGKTYRSARAAAIAAGIIHDVPTVRLTDPDKVGDQLLERMGPEWVAQLAASLTSKLPAPKDDLSAEAKGATKRARSAYHSANSLLAKKANLHLTPLQTVLQFFELHKATNVGRIYHQSLREILDLLPQCDWTVCHPDGWVAMDPEGRTKSTIVSPEMLVKEHIRPLLRSLTEAERFVSSVVNRPAPGRGGVSINIGPASPDDRLRDYLPQRWPAILRERRYFLESLPAYIGRALAMYLEEAEQYHADMGYSSAADLLQQDLGVSPEWMRKVIKAVKR